METIAVLIPCYNEEKTVARVVADLKRELPEAVIYVYDNNSTDATAQRARAQGAVVRREPRQGKGNVVRAMFREVEADCCLMIDGDDTYPAEYARQLCREVLENGADMAIGDRLLPVYFKKKNRPFHSTGNRLMRALVNCLFHSDVKDILTGYRAFSPRFVKSFPALTNGFEIETEMTIFALENNMRVATVPVETRNRPDGSKSKVHTFSDGAKDILTVLRLFRDYRLRGK